VFTRISGAKLLSSRVTASHRLVPRVVPTQGQDFALALVELHEAPVSPFLQPLEVSLDVSSTNWCYQPLTVGIEET